MPNTLQHYRRLGTLGAPPTLLQGQFGLNDPGFGNVPNLYGGGDSGVVNIVGPSRQVYLALDQTITGNKTIDVAHLHIEGGAANYILSTDGLGNLAWVPSDGSLPVPSGTVTGDINFTGDVTINGIPVVADAPADGRLYVRGNESWIILPWTTDGGAGPGTGGGVPEAPSVANVLYGRTGVGGGSWQPVLPMSGGNLVGPLVLDGPPTAVSPPNAAATKGYVDALITGALQFLGTMDGTTGIVTYTTASGYAPGALVPASIAKDQYVLVAVAGTVPGGPIAGSTVGVLDWIISDGVVWRIINHTQIDMLASNVELNPTVFGQTDVQGALEYMETAGFQGDPSWTHLTAAFTEPSFGSTVTIAVENTAWMAIGAPLFIGDSTYIVDSVVSATSVVVERVESDVGSGFLPIAGGSMLGQLVLNASPTLASPPLQAATKEYVDEVGGGYTTVTVDFTPPAIGSSVVVQVGNTAWMDVGQYLMIAAATYIIESVDSPTQVTLRRVSGDGLPPGGGGATISPAAPVSANPGELWWDTISGQLFIFYDDGTSSQWVVAVNQTITGYLPLTGGTLSGPGDLTVNGTMLNNGSRVIVRSTSAGNPPTVTSWNQADNYAAGMWADANGLNFGGLDGTGLPIAQYLLIDTSGDLVTNGSLLSKKSVVSWDEPGNAAAGMWFATGLLNFGSMTGTGAPITQYGYFNTAGNFSVLGTTTSQGTLYANNGRIIAVSAGASFTMLDNAAAYACGMWNSSVPGQLNFGRMDGAGTPQMQYGYFDNAGNFSVLGGMVVTGGISGNSDISARNYIYCGFPTITDFYLGYQPTSRGLNFRAGYLLDLNPTTGVYSFQGDVAGPGTQLLLIDPNGNITARGTITPSASDARMKQEVEAYTAGLTEVCALNPITWKWNGRGGRACDGKRQAGISADEAEALLPYSVVLRPATEPGDDISYKGLDYTPIVAALINAVKELAAELAVVKAKLA